MDNKMRRAQFAKESVAGSKHFVVGFPACWQANDDGAHPRPVESHEALLSKFACLPPKLIFTSIFQHPHH